MCKAILNIRTVGLLCYSIAGGQDVGCTGYGGDQRRPRGQRDLTASLLPCRGDCVSTGQHRVEPSSALGPPAHCWALLGTAGHCLLCSTPSPWEHAWCGFLMCSPAHAATSASSFAQRQSARRTNFPCLAHGSEEVAALLDLTGGTGNWACASSQCSDLDVSLVQCEQRLSWCTCSSSGH